MPEPQTPAQVAEWAEWLAGRPEKVREVAERLPPWKNYRLKTTDQYAVIKHYDEHADGSVTLTIVVWRDWLPIPRGVFGVKPDDLVEDDGRPDTT